MMNSPFRLKLPYKLTLIFSVVIAVMLSGIYLYLLNNFQELSRQRLHQSLRKELAFATTYMEDYLSWPERVVNYDAMANKIGRDLQVRATIIGLDGVVYGDSILDKEGSEKLDNHRFRPEVRDALKHGYGESLRYSTTARKAMLYMAARYKSNLGEGLIRLSIPVEDIQSIYDQPKTILVGGLVGAFLVALIISFFVSNIFSRPITDLSRALKRFAEGDVSARLFSVSEGEIGELAKAFNFMSQQVQQKMDEAAQGRSRLEAILLSMAEGVMAVGRDGHILLMNQSLKDFLQIEGDPVGRNPLEVVRHIEIQEILVETLERKSGVPPAREIFLLFPQEKIVLLHAAPIMREGKLEGAVLVVHDITELRRFEKMRREFVANVSHELRTPVTSIKGYVETLLDGAIDDKDNAVEFLHIISKDAERLIRLIEDLLDLSKIESGQMSMVFKPCAVAMVVERVAAGLARVLHERQCRLRIEIPDDLPPVMADEARLAQVLVNLIDNAVKYSPSGSEVIITATVEKRYVQIDVIDNGIGIPEQDIPRIFERFYRVDKARSRDLGGTGLGLSIVKHIVQAHKGDVRVSSRVGEGSRFSFTIPKAV